ncbi:hypothetical protein WJX73_006714 [Symbiochloris irregularis]|uniref:Cytochrome b5 heme-binding domain-containing protein n=1 Tax=Symbiochloris irregularis TaxID=706552 RepID=A0AAW1PH85_9CHLO
MTGADSFSFPRLSEPTTPTIQNALLKGSTVTHASSTSGSILPAKQVAAARPKEAANRQKVPLEAGCSQMDWLRRVGKRSKETGVSGRQDIPMSEVKQHCTKEDAWTVLRGKVYNITPYLKFHPGGKEMLMKGAGKDCTSLFQKYHAWVNADMLLKADYIGTLDPASAAGAKS